MTGSENSSKLSKFRDLFDKHGISAYVLPSTDAHQSEYLADHDFRVRYLSGFSGSNAFTIITKERALLWTDGRYFAQAIKQFEPGWELMKQAVPESVEPVDWLTCNLKSGDKVAFDPQLFAYCYGINFVKNLESGNLTPLPLAKNLVDEIWNDRPKAPINPITILSVEECGRSTADKFKELRGKFEKKKCDSILFTSLDDIMWLLNIRGFDIPYNPLVYSILFVTNNSAHFFVDRQKLTKESINFLTEVHVYDYEEAEEFIRKYHEENKSSHGKEHKVFIPEITNYFFGKCIGKDHVIIASSPVQAMKAIKNDCEMKGIREAQIRDSVAVIQFLVWLKKELAGGNEGITELIAAAKMDELRSKHEKYVTLSFSTISAVDTHAAFPHYHPEIPEGNEVIKKDSVFLLDSGGHYRDGTTDVTRTVCHSTNPDPYFIKMNTLVLRGHIDTANQNFPDGIKGSRLDALSRVGLWNEGYDFGHGVGHGVGHFLNVHEGPMGISFRSSPNEGTLHQGNVITIEPGYYEVGKFGIRIENCYEIVKSEKLQSGAENFLTFEPLTLVPIQQNLIQRDLLQQKHIDWLNAYHQKCLNKVGPFLKEHGFQEELEFLEKSCQKI
uniref:Xaa-Pro aminopeptidase n=1 Tax=Panagrolaimus superbus TaxID=310955 RepID=A0A914Z6T3_9BILA